jgi:hypothetical protein
MVGKEFFSMVEANKLENQPTRKRPSTCIRGPLHKTLDYIYVAKLEPISYIEAITYDGWKEVMCQEINSI